MAGTINDPIYDEDDPNFDGFQGIRGEAGGGVQAAAQTVSLTAGTRVTEIGYRAGHFNSGSNIIFNFTIRQGASPTGTVLATSAFESVLFLPNLDSLTDGADLDALGTWLTIELNSAWTVPTSGSYTVVWEQETVGGEGSCVANS